MGYSVEWRVINAADYGFAQRRRRVFIFAYKNYTNYYNSLKEVSSKNIIEKEGFFVKEFPIKSNSKSKEIKFEYKDLSNVSDNFKMEFKNSGIMKNGKIYTTEVIPFEIEAKPLSKIIEYEGVSDKYNLGNNLEKWNYLKGAKDILRKAGTPHEYHFREGAIAFPDGLDKPARTMLTSEGSLNRSTHVIEDPRPLFKFTSDNG